METSIDSYGRIVIPKKVREHFNLKTGSPLRIEETPDEIVLKPVHGEPNLVDKGGILVFSGTAVGDIEKSLAQHRNERIKDTGGGFEDTV